MAIAPRAAPSAAPAPAVVPALAAAVALVVVLALALTDAPSAVAAAPTAVAPIAATPTTGAATLPPAAAALATRTLAELADDLATGRTTSVTLVDAYLARIAALDAAGPTLRSVLAVNPDARAQALALDAERRAGRVRGPLHGVPILVKDNVDTADPLPTTAGSLALAANVTARDAPAIARLRAAGAIVLGKTNLSEWANFRSTSSTSGWSAVGGRTLNPHALDRNPCGSSSGSGAAVAASLAAAAIGSETDGSIVCPASANGVVGVKPTVGLVSRTHVVPISASQDTLGPMTATVRDAALLLTAMAGTDPADPATRDADARRRDYTQALSPDALRGVRVGVARWGDVPAPLAPAWERALATLRAAGAELVDVRESGVPDELGRHEFAVLLTEFAVGVNDYLATTPPAVSTRTLADLIEFNRANAARQMPWFAQELFESAAATKGLADPEYVASRDTARRMAGADGIDRLLRENRVAMLVAPTLGPAWMTDLVNGDQYEGPSSSRLAAVAGYPHVTVPMGDVHGMPVGLSFYGAAWTEAELLAAAYAFERRADARRLPQYRPTAMLAAVPAPGAGTAGTAGAAPDEAALLRANAEYDAALVGGDGAALDRLYADDFRYVGPGAVIRDKRAQIAAFTGGAIDLLEGRSDEVVVKRYGDTAAMTGRFTGRVREGGREYSFVERYSAVWVIDDGRWRLALEHGTVVPDGR
jgi:amidase